MTGGDLLAEAGGLLNVPIVLAVAPLLEGVLRKVTAVVQSRQGPPITQPYLDLLKLLGKEDIEAGETPVAQRIAVWLALATALALARFVPMGFPAPMGQTGDAILLIYLLTFSGICTLLIAMAAGSTYSLMGMSREMMTMMALEPLFAVTIVVAAVHAHSLRLGSVLDGAVYAPGAPISGILLLGVLALSFQAFVQRAPFDISEAETELMEGPLLEYSGPKLALCKYAQMVKLVVYSGLFVALFAPWGSDLVFPVGWVFFWTKVLVVVLLVTLVAATHARYRIDHAVRLFASLLAVSMVALVFATFGY